LHVHLRHERASRIEHLEAATTSLFLHRARDTVRAEHDCRIVRHLVEFVDEHRTKPPQPIHHVSVVHDLVAHVDRRTEELERAFDDVDRSIDTGTETSGIRKKNLHYGERRATDGKRENLRSRDARCYTVWSPASARSWRCWMPGADCLHPEPAPFAGSRP